MALRIVGMRLGVNVYTPVGSVRNGVIKEDDVAVQAYLTGIGYRLQRCNGIPEPQPTAEEKAEMQRVETEQKSLRALMQRGLNDLLAPLRKKTYLDQFE